MSFRRFFFGTSIILFSSIFAAYLFKHAKETQEVALVQDSAEIALAKEVRILPAEEIVVVAPAKEEKRKRPEPPTEVDRIEEFFRLSEPRLPIVETIRYTSRVEWQKGRAAWLADYARHYKTSRHFIARSLNGSADYHDQQVREGDRFNVLRGDKDISFYLLVDLSRCRMWFYYLDHEGGTRTLVKSYPVGLGRKDRASPSGHLTPLGKFTLGERVAVYGPQTKGFYQGQRVELIKIFGTRWIPFQEEVVGCTAPARGFGIHGNPWVDGEEDASGVGKHASDGCIRMHTKDVEELYSIIISRPTTVELVPDFYDAKLPGKEV